MNAQCPLECRAWLLASCILRGSGSRSEYIEAANEGLLPAHVRYTANVSQKKVAVQGLVIC